jgi:hypothetical protein
MTKAQLDLAYRLAGELSIYAKAIDQYGNQRISACMRNAASILEQMVEEAATHGEMPIDPREG